jgi:tetratricopeptide (TPR) repeat protein
MRRSAEVGRRALTIAVEIGDQHLEGEAAFGLGQTHASLGDHRGAEELYRRNVSPLPAELTADAAGALPWFASVSRAWLANSLAQLGRFDEGLVLGAEALRVARALDNPFWLIVAHYQLGMLHQYRGRFADSVALFEQVLSIGQSRDISDFATQSAAELATAHARLGRITEAVEWARSSLSLFSGRRAEVCFLAGQREEALEAAEQELARWRQEGRRGLEGWVLYWLGEIARHRDPPDADAAERYYLEALDRATELGMRPLVAHCHLGLGQLYRRTGDQGKAQEHLTTATTMYREMDMRFWLEQAEAELKEPPA